MDRRSFLRFLGAGAAAAVAPTKTYAFFGNILRPKPTWREETIFGPCARRISPTTIEIVDEAEFRRVLDAMKDGVATLLFYGSPNT